MHHDDAEGAAHANALASWALERERRRSSTPETEGDEERGCRVAPPDPCEPAVPADGPEQIVHFRQAVPFASLSVALGDSVEGVAELEFACVRVTELTAAAALDLRYEQWWYFQRKLIAALSASIGLAPGERLSLSLRNTQRKQFDRETVEEVERTEATESTIADKDVLNVTRSSSRTNNWNVNANASISLPEHGLGGGISGSVSETVTEAATSSAQRTHDSTQKAASNLKTLQKVQIRETSEVATEASTSRTIQNPYRDRSLRLDAYELAKEYCVEFHLREIVPVIVLNCGSVDFSRRFVLTNAAFLADELTDRPLEFELSEALQTTSNLRLEGAQERAEALALIAFDYLFGVHPVFNFGDVGGTPEGWDENDPANSFQLPFEDWGGLTDATANNVGVIISVLAVYYRLYVDRIAGVDGRLAVEAAMSLDSALAPRWIGVEETDAISNVIDAQEGTEVLRRLGGFLAMTSGMLRPLLQPAEEERASRRAAERAEFVIGRVVDHLNCHARYYTEEYLRYIGERTRMRAVSRLASDVLARIAELPPALLERFDPDAAFLDGSRIVVPIRLAVSLAELQALLKHLDADAGDIELGLLDVQSLTIPTDGMHVEASAGSCSLDGTAEEPIAGPLHVALHQP